MAKHTVRNTKTNMYLMLNGKQQVKERDEDGAINSKKKIISLQK